MQPFFFTESEMKTSVVHDPSLSCAKCGLFEDCNSPKMKPYGEGKKRILLIGEFPGLAEDKRGVPFAGESGRMLASYLADFDIDMDRDCVRTNANICHPARGKDPTNSQLMHCRKMLYRVIEEMKPAKILTFGHLALKGLIGDRVKVGKLNQWIGSAIPDQELKAWVYPNYHPEYVVSASKENPAYELWFDKIIELSIKDDRSFYEANYANDVHLLRDTDEIVAAVRSCADSGLVSFDYETTGLKPYNKGHRIICASICDGLFSYAFPFKWEDDDFKSVWGWMLENPDVKKIAHNLKFESLWSKVILGIDVKGWVSDTMIGAHILRNTGGTGLKMQTYRNFGVAGYEDDVKDFIKSPKEDGANGFNRLEHVPLDRLLQYCGEDSIYTYKLDEMQKGPLRDHYSEAFDLFMRSTYNFEKMERVGFRVESGYYQDRRGHVIDERDKCMKEILGYSSVPRGFNPGSPKQVADLLYDSMGLSNDDGSRSTAADVLEKLNHPLSRNILAWKRWDKLAGTYLDGFIRETSDDGFLHTFFNLNIASTYRSSSSNPNFHNIPKRDPEIQKLARSGLFPRRGQQLIELDFKSIEVCISACYHKDPAMIEYIMNPETDMHRDLACRIFFRDESDYSHATGDFKKLLKDERYLAKNGFVFPQFYGDYYGNCARSMWDRASKETKDHLKANGIRNIDMFITHVELVENWMWYTRFPVYAAWKDSNWEKYLKRGYIDLFTGFRCQGVMEKNQVNNFPVQGTAFHVNLEAIDDIMCRTESWETDALSQVHDSIVFSMEPDECDDLIHVAGKGLGRVSDKFADWLIVPLQIEYEIGAIDQPWYGLEDGGIIKSIA